MTPLAWLLLAFLGLVATALTGIAVKALHHYPRHEMEELCRRDGKPELFNEILDSHEEIAVGVESLRWGAALVTVLASCAAWLAEHPDQAISFGGFSAALGVSFLMVLILGVWIPWAVVDLWAAPFVYHTWQLWWVAGRMTTPLRLGVWIFDAIFRRLSGRRETEADEEEAFAEEIRSMVTEGHRDGLLEADARQMIERVIDLGDADAADVMMPRSAINALPIGLSWQETLRFVIECRRTRIPVYENTLDKIVGILYVKDLLPELLHTSPDKRRPLREILRRPHFIPDSMRLDLLLRDFLRSHTHIAIVLDEYKGVAGLVTLEDLLEEIVGEIVDESDRALVRSIETIDEHTAEVMARTHVGDLNQALNLDLPEDDEEYDTIGGFVVRQLGRIPQPGEVVTWEGGRITVVKANRRGVERVRIERNQPAA